MFTGICENRYNATIISFRQKGRYFNNLCFSLHLRLSEQVSRQNAGVMASLEVAIWKLAGSSWRLLTWLDQHWSRNTAQQSQSHSRTVSCNSGTTITFTNRWLRRTKSWFISTRPQTTAYETRPQAPLECWEGHAEVTLYRLRDADLFVTLVILGTAQWNNINRSSADVSSCGAAPPNASYAMWSTR